jgi:hypothetical protein
VKRDGALLGREQAGEAGEEAGFAHAGRADDGDKRAAWHLKIEVAELLVDASTTPVIGDIAYIIPVATASVGGCVSPTSTTGYYRIGVFKSAKYTNPAGRPAGSYALVSFDGTHNELVP